MAFQGKRGRVEGTSRNKKECYNFQDRKCKWNWDKKINSNILKITIFSWNLLSPAVFYQNVEWHVAQELWIAQD